MSAESMTEDELTEWYEEEYRKRKEQLKSRKCPFCGEPIKVYTFASTLIPFEIVAQHATFVCGNMYFPYSLYFAIRNTPLNFCRVVLSSTCECGSISQWNCDRFSLMALLDKNMGDEGYCLEQMYHKETLEMMLKRSGDKQFNENIEKLLRLYVNDAKTITLHDTLSKTGK